MLEQSWKKVTWNKSIPVLQPEHGFFQQNGPERGQLKDWYCILLTMMKTKSICLFYFFEDILSMLLFKGKQIISSSHVGIRNIPTDNRYLLRWHKTLPSAICTQAYSEPNQAFKIECFVQTVNILKSLTGYPKTLHLRCLKGFLICLCWKARLV